MGLEGFVPEHAADSLPIRWHQPASVIIGISMKIVPTVYILPNGNQFIHRTVYPLQNMMKHILVLLHVIICRCVFEKKENIK